jgi:hypothetical protein
MIARMSMMHTPAPWVVDGKGCRLAGVGDVVNADFVSLVEICAPSKSAYYDLSADERNANARLISAAPELLAACCLLLDDGVDCECGSAHCARCVAKIAIAKAEGRS